MADTPLTGLSPMPPPVQPTDLTYVVRPGLGAAGSHNNTWNRVLSRITDGIGDKTLRFGGLAVEPGLAGASEGAIYLDTALGRFRISIGGVDASAFESLVTDPGVATLSNKTLLLPVIADFTNAQHNHSSGAQGGLISFSSFSGVVSVAQGGTGLSTAPTDGQLLIGKTGVGYVLGTLGAASPISISVSPGSATVSLTGIVSPANGGTGLNASTAANGQVFIGTGAGLALATITVTPSTNLSITNGSGSITLAGSTSPIIASFANVQAGAILSTSNGGTGLAVAPTAITDGMLLVGSNAGDAFVATTLTAGANVTITNAAGSITIASTASGGGGMAIGGAISGGATTGSVLFVASGALLGQDNSNLFWDDSNNRLGLGTASPAAQLHAEIQDSATTTTTTQVLLRHNSSGTPGAGFGTNLTFALKDSTTTNQVAALLTAQWSVATHGSQTGILRVLTVTGGASSTEVGRFLGDSLGDGGLQVGTPAGDGFIKFASSGIVGATLLSFGNGAVQFLDQLSTGWGAIILGPTTTAGMRIKNGPGATSFHFRAGDDSGWTGLSCGNTDLVTNDVALGLAVIHETTGTPTTGFGTGITFQGSTTTTLNRIMGSFRITWTDSTDATRSAQVTIAVVQNGATESGVAIFDKTGALDLIGLQVWDPTAGAIVRVSRGVSNSGGSGFRVLRIPN